MNYCICRLDFHFEILYNKIVRTHLEKERFAYEITAVAQSDKKGC